MKFAALFALLAAVALAAPPAFRTDGGDEKLPWYQPKAGEFPPEGSAHYIGGELIEMDHINRTGILRMDRTDAIRRSEWDQPLPFKLLPYGTVTYHGGPAELRDVPIGTHLHGHFYWDEKAGKDGKGAFTKALRLEDDFSYHARQGRAFRVEAVQADAGTLTVVPTGGAEAAEVKSIVYQITPATRVWKGRCVGTPADVQPGQTISLNITVATLKGPGRCTDLWLDEESRVVAAAHQVEVHRQFMREHGLAGWVDTVDNQEGAVTVTLFAGFDPALLSDFVINEGVNAAVAEESLRTYDQNNDRVRGPILAIQRGEPGVGNSGIRVTFKPAFLVEGFRPRRYLRLFSGRWKMDDLPKEERLYQ